MKKHAKNTIFEKVGMNVSSYRAAKGVTQEGLGASVGLTANYIACVERGERGASIEGLVKIAEALDCKLVDLVKGL